MKIRGGNLDDCESELKAITEWGYDKDLNVGNEVLQYLQNIFWILREKAKTTEVREFLHDGDKVCILPGMINHKCSNDIEVLKTIFQFGILASEWFGILESEREGTFCSFVDRIKPEEYKDSWDNYRRLKSQGDDVVLFFDSDNEVMQYLLHLDYFEYERIKKQNPEKLHEIYLPEEIMLFESLIAPLSPAGKNYHDDSKKDKPFFHWSAIPGGIPSELVNGICLKNNQYSDGYVQELSSLFPNAIIFNGNLEIVYKPDKNMESSKNTL